MTDYTIYDKDFQDYLKEVYAKRPEFFNELNVALWKAAAELETADGHATARALATKIWGPCHLPEMVERAQLLVGRELVQAALTAPPAPKSWSASGRAGMA
jgi:hypothetical protein